MPVSPQDYALWSRMTGNPIPTSPAERMAVAPQVYDFSRNLGRRTEKSGLRKAVDVIGKAALAAGAVAGAAALASKFGGTDDGGVEEVEIKDVSEPSESTRVSPKGFLSSAISGLGDEGPAEPEAPTPTPGGEPEDVVKVTQIEMPSRGVSSEDIVQAVQTAKSRTPAERKASRLVDAPDFGDTAEIQPKDLALYEQHVEAVHRRGVSERAQQFLNRLGLDDEVAVDNDIIAQNPGSNTALASQDITSADPASAIGQRISTNQTGAAVAARSAAEPRQTVASKLSQQQSPVHLEEADTELVGAPAPGAAEAFKKGRQYQEMKQRYEGLQDIASPGTEGVSSSAVLPTVRRSTPIPTAQPTPGGASSAEIAELDALLARGMSTTPESERIAIRNRQLEKKYGAAPAVVTEEVEVAKPAGVAPVAFLKEKASTVMPQATQRGTVEHAVAEAMERLEGERGPAPEGTISYGQPYKGSPTKGVRLYPSGQVGWQFKDAYGKGTTEYGHNVDPEFMPYLKEGLERGDISTADYNKLKAMGVLTSTVGYNA